MGISAIRGQATKGLSLYFIYHLTRLPFALFRLPIDSEIKFNLKLMTHFNKPFLHTKSKSRSKLEFKSSTASHVGGYGSEARFIAVRWG